MKKNKLERFTLEELAAEMPIVKEDEQQVLGIGKIKLTYRDYETITFLHFMAINLATML